MSNIKTQKSIEPTLNNYLDLVFGELNEKEYMVVEAHGIPNEQKICNSKNEIIDFLSRYYYDHNIFVALATSKGENRKEENLYATSVLAFDFDKKDHPGLSVEKLRKMVYEKCGLFMSMIVDSGHGYHVYVQVKKTNDIARWNRITKEFAGIIGADMNATKSTQIMRLPFSKNNKAGKTHYPVNLLYITKGEPYSLDELEMQLEKIKKKQAYDERLKTRFTVFSKNRYCISQMLAGVNEGYRNFAMRRLYSHFHFSLAKSDDWIRTELRKWNERNTPPKSDDEFERELDLILRNQYNCNSCNPQETSIQTSLDLTNLKNFCSEDLCEFHQNILRKNYKSVNEEITVIPQYLLKKSTLSALTGNELALLLYVFFIGGTIDLKELYGSRLFCEKSIKKLIESLKRHRLIVVENNSLSLKDSILKSESFEIKECVKDAVLNGQLKGFELEVYLHICWMNSSSLNAFQGEFPTSLAIANLMEKDYSNVSKVINTLIEKEYVDNDMRIYGLGHCNHLAA